MRLLLLNQSPFLTLPLVTRVETASVRDEKLIIPMVQELPPGFPKPIIVADMGYLDADIKRQLRIKHHIALLTKVRRSMKTPDQFDLDSDGCPTCIFGQRLMHDHFDWEKQQHLYLKPERGCECSFCPYDLRCPQEFWFSSEIHETYLGAQPLHTKLAQKLFKYARPFVETANSEDKNRFMLGAAFINSLDLAGFMSLLVDSAKLITVLARLKKQQGKSFKRVASNIMRQLPLPL